VSGFEDACLRDLAERRGAGLFRVREARSPSRLPWLRLGGRRLVGFASNDYLGLATDSRVGRAFARAARRWGVGAGAAATLGGYSEAHAMLEAALARAVGRPRALVFSTGYMANLGLLGAFASRGRAVYADRLDHASILDAVRLSGARLKRYPHAEVGALARLLADEPARGGPPLVVSESIFSMEGDRAPLGALVACARSARAVLAVDDAHGFGILGPRGGGSLVEGGWSPEDVPLYVATLGKAVGVFGAFVAGSEAAIEVLVQRARTALFTTALPPAVCAAAVEALALLQAEEWRRTRLFAHVERFRRGLVERGLPSPQARGPIQPLVVGSPERALELSARLREAGYYVPAVRPPTVPAGTSRLRVSLSALHEEREIEGLLDALEEAWPLVREDEP